MSKLVVTFDLFSALIDSRRGGSAAFGRLARCRSWQLSGEAAYQSWDAHNKALQKEVAQRSVREGATAQWASYRELAGLALARLYSESSLAGDPHQDAEVLIDSMAAWPLWPDVDESLPELAAEYRIGLLSNVDDDIFADTRAARLIDHRLAMTSQRLRAYKPGEQIYVRARKRLDSMVHVATSARDVRGAVEAGCPVIRLRRPGHLLDSSGPAPLYEAGGLSELPRLIAELS